MGGEMTREEIIRMAREAGMVRLLDEHAHEYGNGMFENTEYPQLEKFAALVAAAEREQCARVCERERAYSTAPYPTEYTQCAAAIRARGQQ